MSTTEEYIASGILELYVLGAATEAESAEVEQMAALHPAIKAELLEMEAAMAHYAIAHAIAPDPIVKPFLMAIADYSDRMMTGEQPSFPPLLSEKSTAGDFAPWLQRADMVAPAGFDDIYAKIIGYTPEALTAIVWLKTMAPHEVHTVEHEKFLILEGTCDIDIEGHIHHLAAGSFLTIPLHAGHTVKITSTVPCKLILQRVAA